MQCEPRPTVNASAPDQECVPITGLTWKQEGLSSSSRQGPACYESRRSTMHTLTQRFLSFVSGGHVCWASACLADPFTTLDL